MLLLRNALNRYALAGAVSGMAALLSPAGNALADEAEMKALRQEIAELRARVERLEAELDSGVAVNPAKVVQPEEGGWHTPSNWNLLTPGMGPGRVIEILGEPDRVRAVSKYEFWHYGDGIARFYLGRLKSWDKP